MKRKSFVWALILSTIFIFSIFIFTQKYSENFTDGEPQSVGSADSSFEDYTTMSADSSFEDHTTMSADRGEDAVSANGNDDIHIPEKPVSETSSKVNKKPKRKKENKIQLINGVTNFVLPSTMFVDTSYMGYLGISTYLTYSELHGFLEKAFYDENPVLKESGDSLILSQGGKDKIKIYPVMKADLRDVTLESKKFDISPISSDWQAIDLETDSVFVWRWNITPKSEGTYRLQFNIYGSLNITHENNKHILLFNKEIKVKAVKAPISVWDNVILVAKSINDYGGVLTTGLCGTILFFFRDKILGLFKKRKPQEPKL